MPLYLDTNIFIYLSDEKSDYHSACWQFINFCKTHGLILVTSVETIQEIIHYAKNIKRLENGIDIASATIDTVSQLLPLTSKTIAVYLNVVQTYLSPSSRDCVHLATCIENQIQTVISYDKDFSKFHQIKALTPSQFMAKN